MSLSVPFTFAMAGLNTPTTQLDADYQAITDWINARNPTSGTIGSRPAAGNAGALYVATDQNNQVYLDTGTVWLALSAIPGTLVIPGTATPTTPAAGSGTLYSPLGNPPLQRLGWIDSAAQLWEYAATMRALRLVGNPAKTVVSTMTETSVYSAAPTIKGGTLGTTRRLVIRVIGDILNNTVAPHGFTLKVKYGGATIGTYTNPGVTVDATRYGWSLETWMTALGTTGDQAAWGRLFVAGSPGVSGTSETFTGGQNALSSYTSFSQDSTLDQTFDITVTLPVAQAALSLRVFSVDAELG